MNTHTRSLSDEVRLSDRGLAFLSAMEHPTEPMTDEFEAWVALMDAKPSE